MSGGLIYEEDERICDDEFMTERTCDSMSGAGQPSTARVQAPMSSPTLQQQAARDQSRAQDQKSIACDSTLRAKETNAQLHGTAQATKMVFFGAKMTVSELNASRSVSFDAGTLDSIWKVHGRNEKSRGVRVGDPSSVMITEAALVSTFSTSDVPVFLSCNQMGGKVYPCLSDTGRQDGRAHRKLAVIGHGTKHYGASNVVYRRVRAQLSRMSRVTGSYDVDSLIAGCTDLVAEGYETTTLVLQTSYISQFITAHAERWRLNPAQFKKENGFVFYPKSLVQYAVNLLKLMAYQVANQKHNLRALCFNVQSVCSNGTPAAALMSGNDSVYIGFMMMIKYTFLNEGSLVRTA